MPTRAMLDFGVTFGAIIPPSWMVFFLSWRFVAVQCASPVDGADELPRQQTCLPYALFVSFSAEDEVEVKHQCFKAKNV